MVNLKTFNFFCALLKTSIRASISSREAFLIESILMIGNNLIFFSIWWIFFLKFDEIGGWTIREMAASMAILSGSYGLAQICFGGVKTLGPAILNGDLDPFMLQPKNLLFHFVGSKSRSRGWGHLLTTIALIFLGHLSDPKSLALMGMACISGALILTSLGVMAASLTFWVGPIESVTQKYLDSIFVFALYPTNIYSGALQLIMFTLVPAGLIGFVPVELLRKFEWTRLALLILSCSLFFILAVWTFYRGLKRYESGNQFGVKG